MSTYELIASKGCGSAIIEMALQLAGLPHKVTTIPYLTPGPERDRLLRINPLGQVPTLLLPDGTVMTESAAMVLHINDAAPQAGLVPSVGDPSRARFLNLLVVLVAAIYPTFTFGDDPKVWDLSDEAASTFRAATDSRRVQIWQHIETTLAPAPYAFGSRMSAADLYLATMTLWKPRREWFAENCTRIMKAVDATMQNPVVREVLDRNA
jgi:GST-like protein